MTLGELLADGASETDQHRRREHPPATALEWVALAVARVPELDMRARTADELNWGSRSATAARLYAPLLDRLAHEIAAAAALIDAALTCHLRLHPHAGAVETDVEGYAELVLGGHRRAPRRAELLIGGYVSFLAGAIEATGALTEARVAAAANGQAAELAAHAASVYEALVNALGGLLAYARLTTADRARPA